MLTNLTLKDFKSFEAASLPLTPFTLVLGANAAGKSNLLDALRVLHGLARGYTAPEVLGGVWREGVRVWSGVRGGARECCRHGTQQFTLEAAVGELCLRVSVALDARRVPFLALEELARHGQMVVGVDAQRPAPPGVLELPREECELASIGMATRNERAPDGGATPSPGHIAQTLLTSLRGLRFLDLDPEAMRQPSVPGVPHLGDRGENLSAVLQAICQQPERRAALSAWISQLTPMDVTDLDFLTDGTGKVLLQLLERDGRRTSAYAASDGTLRFLGRLAAIFSGSPEITLVIEEIDTGLHPARLDLLLQLLSRYAGTTGPAVIATTHSPALLRLMGPERLEQMHLAYRLAGHGASQLVPLSQLPGIQAALEHDDLGNLHDANWFETVLSFAEAEKPA